MFLENLSQTSQKTRIKEVMEIFLEENPKLKDAFTHALTLEKALEGLRVWVLSYLKARKHAYDFYMFKEKGREAYERLSWRDMAAIRILDYIDNTGRKFEDLNLQGKQIENNPFGQIWEAVKNGKKIESPSYLLDMIYLFRQFNGYLERTITDREQIEEWMNRHPAGLDKVVVEMRKKNKERILKIIIRNIDEGKLRSEKYAFTDDMSEDDKMHKACEWWDTSHFHLKFAVRTPELLNEMLENALDEKTLKLMDDAKEKGIPFFVNPYYLSLLNVNAPDFAKGADQAIHDYVFVSRELIDEFGDIVAWEKEDIVEPGKPNAAGWILPSHHNVHRRYPEVAILIPDTVGRACGGLCVSCQRMYDFQSGHLNFDLDKLKPKEKWPDKLKRLLIYYENDAQLRDILITGGDALMSTNRSLKLILDEVYAMALRKIEANKSRPDKEKFAQMLRVRLGTRLPVYLPQRITDELVQILADFKEKASAIGFKQFVIQTHFESAMEITPEVKTGIDKILSAGWIVTNQQVFTTAASVRGHTAKLRKVLNDIGVLTYYTFSVKGYQENKHNFATNARAVQEQIEEKKIGEIPEKFYDKIRNFPLEAEKITENIEVLRQKAGLPFLGTDRNVLNLPGVGKSLTFRTIGITEDGRRILEFDHDTYRRHSPLVNQMGKVIIIESKTIREYLLQLKEIGEDISEYESLWGYSTGVSEPRIPIYKYPDYDFETTDEFTNFEMTEVM